MLKDNFDLYFRNYIYDCFYIEKGLKNTLRHRDSCPELTKLLLNTHIQSQMMSGKPIVSDTFTILELKKGIRESIGDEELLKKYLEIRSKAVIKRSV